MTATAAGPPGPENFPGAATGRRRDLAFVVGFSVLVALPFLNKAWHVDEAHYLPVARQILRDPIHPFAFELNWYGRSAPMSTVATQSPLVPFVLAPAWALTGGREWAVRLALIPFDLMAAVALYLLAARFLARPLWPVLIVLAGPAYVVNLQQVQLEKWTAAFGFGGLHLLLRGLEEERRPLFWGSAALLGVAILAKNSGVFLLAPAACLCWTRGAGPRKTAGLLAAAALPAVLYLGWSSTWVGGGTWEAIRSQSEGAAGMPWAALSHRMRALLAFLGGCGVATAIWPFAALRGRSLVAGVMAAAACAVLYLPVFDLGAVRPVDRGLGIALSFGAAMALVRAAASLARRPRGWDLWAPWLAAVLLLQAAVYWSVVSRFVLFAVAPLTFALAAVLERRLAASALRTAHLATFAATLALTLALGSVDARHAGVQRDLAGLLARERRPPGSRVWFTGHWGLQEYLERAGARAIDGGRGGWDAVSAGDLVVVPLQNANVLRTGPRRADVRTLEAGHPIPLRLVDVRSSQAAFYSSASGFLPFAISSDPVESFDLVEPR